MNLLKFSNTCKALLMTIILFSACLHANAQFAFSIGPKGGLALTTFNETDADNVDSRTSWFGGVFTNFQLGKVVALQPEFLLTEKGAKVTENNTSSNFSINYFEVPVLAKIRLPLANEVIFPHILLGPYFAFKTDFDATSTDTQTGSSIKINTSDIRKSEVGALVGAGIDIQTHKSGVFFTLDGRYGWSFHDLNDNDDVITLKNAGWTFAAGIGLRLGNASADVDN